MFFYLHFFLDTLTSLKDLVLPVVMFLISLSSLGVPNSFYFWSNDKS